MIQISHDKYESDLSDAVAGVHSDKCDCSDGIFFNSHDGAVRVPCTILEQNLNFS